MKKPIRVKPQARTDLAEAVAWYDHQRPGLGDEFLLVVEASIAFISRLPKASAAVEGDIRRRLTDRFPHAIYYVEDPGEVVILAVLHTRRNPKVWRRRRST